MSGSIASASYSSTSDLLQGTGSVGFTTTASFNAVSSSQQQISSSQQQISASLLNVIAIGATTGSNSFRANQSITGSLVVSSTITAQTLIVQTVTSSIVYSSGSNLFGNQLVNTQTFTGSVNITGSLAIAGNINGNAITATGLLYANGGESNTLYTGAFLWTPGSYNFFNQKTDHSLVIGTYNANSPVAALTITQAGTSIFSNTVCASILTAATVSAGSPTNSRIVANANTMYGYYDVEVNPRWTLGRDVWAGGSGGLAFGVGGTTTCYSMVGDPSGYGCTIAFATSVPSGCSGTIYEKMRITNSGHLLIGTTTDLSFYSAWDSGVTRIGTSGVLFSYLNNSDNFIISQNYYVNAAGADVRIAAASASNIYFSAGSIYLRTTGTGAAGSATSWNNPLTLTIGGNVAVAITSPKDVFDVGYGNAHGTISTWCKSATNGTMYNAFDIFMDEASFAGALYVQANGGGVGIQDVYDVIASYDRICVIVRNCMNRGNSESLTIPSYTYQAGSKRICIQQNNGAATGMNISAMLVGTAYGGSYICAQA
jgi:hypothetical protein